ncbi:hypothetical protein ACFLUY_01145 [Chloroflexota bacterium]
MKNLQVLLCAVLVLSLLVMPLVGCAKPLTLTVYQPQHGARLTSSPVTVDCFVSDTKATVKINNTKVSISERGYSSVKVSLKEGENTIKVVATYGKESVSKTLIVTYAPSQ